jgi:formylglycine-generating enzyme required for sulfatase activity
MAGNVWEWLQDWDDSDYYDHSPSLNPTGPSTGPSRVLRGGSWSFNSRYVRSADRDFDPPDRRYDDYGFRCASPRLPSTKPQ